MQWPKAQSATQAWAQGYIDAYNGRPRKRGMPAGYYAGYDALPRLRLTGPALVAIRRLALGIGDMPAHLLR